MKKRKGDGHIWNMEQINDGKYYWVDATWDDQNYEEFQYTYFLVGNNNFEDYIVNLPTDESRDFLYELPHVSNEDYEGRKTGRCD